MIYGKKGGVLDIDLANFNSAQGFRILGATAGEMSGNSVSTAGDVNDDNIADIVIGAYNASSKGITKAGTSYVMYGKVGEIPDLDLANFNNTQGFKILGAAGGDQSGQSVSTAGDVNGDNIADIAIGAFQASPEGKTQAGTSYVIYGRKGDLFDIDLSSFNNTEGFRIFGATAGDWSGFSISTAGDVNGDNMADLVIGAPNASPEGRSNTGASYVIYGEKGSLPDIDLARYNETNLAGADYDQDV